MTAAFLALAIAQTATPTGFTEWGMEFQPRHGSNLGVGSPWDAAGISRYTDNRPAPPGFTNRRISINAENASAGVKLVWKAAPARYTVYLEGPLYTLDPVAVAAVWLYDDTAGRQGGLELDWEFSSWGDTHSPFRHTVGYFDRLAAGTKTQIPTTTAVFHKVQLEQGPNHSAVRVWDWRDSDARWVEVAAVWYNVPSSPGATLRIGLWRPGPHKYPLARRGLSRMWVGGVVVEPL